MDKKLNRFLSSFSKNEQRIVKSMIIKKCNVSLRTVNNWLNGKSVPTLKTLQLLDDIVYELKQKHFIDY